MLDFGQERSTEGLLRVSSFMFLVSSFKFMLLRTMTFVTTRDCSSKLDTPLAAPKVLVYGFEYRVGLLD